MVTETRGVVRVARQVLLTIVINAALHVPGVVRVSGGEAPAMRVPGRQFTRQGVALSVKDNSVSADLFLVVARDADIVAVGSTVQQEVAAAIEHMVGMQVREVNIYIQDVA